MCGVNGTGKTTTIGKLAYQYHQQGLKVMVAACDTFRAAAVDQLKVWAERAHVPIITGKLEADPASVAFEALQMAKEKQADILLVDTAGRLHNKKNLMEQLAKIIRVLQKADETAPHDCIIVIDATTGQNARLQVKTFKDIVAITGIIVTKLDGTAKGGIVVSLAQEFALPIHAVGVGEAIEDLQPFDAKIFANSLLGLD
jgi:fused signal recognition particle receptor